MYRDTVTLFNCKRGRDGDTWYPAELNGVNLNKDKGAVVKQYGAESTDNTILFIKYQHTDTMSFDGGIFGDDNTTVWDGGKFNPWVSSGFGAIQIGDYIWLPPKEWQELDDPTGYITFDPDGDFFWDGVWTGSVAYEGAYGDQSFYEYMLSKYDFVYAITSVNYLSVIPHFEVTGR